MIKKQIDFILKVLKFNIKDLSNLLNIRLFKIYKLKKNNDFKINSNELRKIEEIYKIALFFQKHKIEEKNFLLTDKLDNFVYSLIDCINNNTNYDDILRWIKSNHKRFNKFPSNYKEIEIRIQELRKTLNISVLELSDILGITHQAMSLWKIHNKIPKYNNISTQKLLNLFKLLDSLKFNKFDFFYNFLLKEKIFNHKSILDFIKNNENINTYLKYILNISKDIKLFKNKFKNVEDLQEHIQNLTNKYNITNNEFKQNLFIKLFICKFDLKKIIFNIKKYLNLDIKLISDILDSSINTIYFIQNKKNLDFSIIKKIYLLNDLSIFYKKNKIKNKDFLIKDKIFSENSIINQIAKLENYAENIDKLKENHQKFKEKLDDSQIFLKNILNLKENLNLTVRELSDMLEITFCSIYKWKDKKCIPLPNEKKTQNIKNLNLILDLFKKYNISFKKQKFYFQQPLSLNKNFIQLYHCIDFNNLYKLFDEFLSQNQKNFIKNN